MRLRLVIVHLHTAVNQYNLIVSIRVYVQIKDYYNTIYFTTVWQQCSPLHTNFVARPSNVID